MMVEDEPLIDSNMNSTGETESTVEETTTVAIAVDVPPSSATDEYSIQCKENTFEGLYDDIFEVELPCTMYGVHRDPQRTFIAITLIDPKTMATAKALYIDRCLCTKLIVDGRTVDSTEHEDLTVDEISQILSTLDDLML